MAATHARAHAAPFVPYGRTFELSQDWQALGGDSEKVIREFMNEGRDKTENEQTINENKEMKKDINQEIYSSIRTFMNQTKKETCAKVA